MRKNLTHKKRLQTKNTQIGSPKTEGSFDQAYICEVFYQLTRDTDERSTGVVYTAACYRTGCLKLNADFAGCAVKRATLLHDACFTVLLLTGMP